MECKPKASDEESPPSSMDSCSGELLPPAPAQSTASSGCRPPPAMRRRGLISTDLHLGHALSICSSVHTDTTTSSSTLRSALTTVTTTTTADQGGCHGRQRSLFVKVYMEGVPIGRKLDLLLLDGYNGLVDQLAVMFRASITYPDAIGCHQQFAVVGKTKKMKVHHVLTYEDHEGDWMMAGDVPWELFLANVKRLRIARTDNKYAAMWND